jgi:hypothetical protein
VTDRSQPGRPLILSASRRTDLPGFHAAECAHRIRARVARLRTRELYGVVFWTRHVKPFLPGGELHALTRREIANPLVNLTVTGLGRSALEPGSPSPDETLPLLPALVEAFHGEPWRIRWRFDPLLPEWTSVDDFARIAAVMRALGVETCTFSFPAYRSLKGDLTPSFERAGIRPWRETEKAEILSELAAIAAEYDIALLSCCQPKNLELNPAIAAASCVPRELLERGHPQRLPLELGRDRSQRTHCNCVESEDIGDYEKDRCGGGCVYCYSKAGGP